MPSVCEITTAASVSSASEGEAERCGQGQASAVRHDDGSSTSLERRGEAKSIHLPPHS